MDDRNLYAPPASDVTQVDGPRDRSNEFFVISPGKFWLLFIATFSLYQLYWFYMHWARYRRAHPVTVWPLARAIFSLFFAHALANRIAQSLRASGRTFAWKPAFAATVYVLAQLISNLIDRIPLPGWSDSSKELVLVLMIVPTGLAMAQIQAAANVACGDPRGESNRRLTPANYAWLAVCVLLWALIGFGMSG